MAAKRAEPDRAFYRHLTGLQREAVVVHHQEQPVALHRRARGREIERHDRNAVEADILPDVQLGPVGDRDTEKATALVLPGLLELSPPTPLVLRVTTKGWRDER